MVRAIVGYSNAVICAENEYTQVLDVTRSNLVLSPDQIPKHVVLNLVTGHNFQNFLTGVVKKIDKLVLTAVDQTGLCHLFEFSGIQFVTIKEDELCFEYQEARLVNTCVSTQRDRTTTYLKTSVSYPVPRFLSEAESRDPKHTTHTEYADLKIKHLNSRGKQVETLSYLKNTSGSKISAPWRPTYDCSKLAVKIVWDDISCEEIEKELSHTARDLNWYRYFISDLDQEVNRLKKQNKKIRIKNNISKFFRITWYLLKQPIGI